jgi:putative endonuclease
MCAAPHSGDHAGPGDHEPRSGDGRQTLGRLGERLAAEHLARRGFQIVERNFRTRWGELDIVAFDGRTLVFCEVKTRRSGPGGIAPFDSLHPRKRTQVRKIARYWLSSGARRPIASELRFDAIGITVDRSGRLVALEHLEGAF